MYNRHRAVALPWVNDASGNIQNCATFANDNYTWHNDTTGLSWQPFLLHITRQICDEIGYSHDFFAWEEREVYRYLLMCNCLPHSWYTPEFARALPHWTVEEYFEKLELFLGCEFDIDHRTRSIGFRFSADALAAVPGLELTTSRDPSYPQLLSSEGVPLPIITTGRHWLFSVRYSLSTVRCSLLAVGWSLS